MCHILLCIEPNYFKDQLNTLLMNSHISFYTHILLTQDSDTSGRISVLCKDLSGIFRSPKGFLTDSQTSSHLGTV